MTESANALRPAQLVDLLGRMLGDELPVLLVGPPGVGKTAIVRQVAERMGAVLLVDHASLADPTDAKGLPFRNAEGTEAVFLPFDHLARAKREGAAGRKVLWFLDELGQASPAVQGSYMSLMDRATFGELPNLVFCAASNRRQDRAGVQGLLEPVKSRFAAVIELVPSAEDWIDWGAKAGIAANVLAFIRFRPELLLDFKPTADIVNSPSPRTWARLSRVAALDLPPELRFAAYAGCVGEGAAAEYLAFERMTGVLPDLDAILRDPDAAPVPSQPSILYAVITALGLRASLANADALFRYAQRLWERGKGDFAAMLVRDVYRRDRAIASTPAFAAMSATELGRALSGG